MSATYKAIQAIGPGTLQAVELPIVEPPPGHVRIRIEACGICHTDAFTVEGGFPGFTYPRLPSHEAVGKIDALGTGVECWHVGQRVGIGLLGGHWELFTMPTRRLRELRAPAPVGYPDRRRVRR